MRKKYFFLLSLLFMLPIAAFSASLERYCFQSTSGNLYDLRGGKLGKKAFTLEATIGSCPPTPGLATTAKLTTGYLLTIMVGRNLNGVCGSFVISALADEEFLSASGNFDNLPRNWPPDGNVLLTRVACPELNTSTKNKSSKK